ncbi:MAG: YabP/YqfC family sporulation protein [Clostridia bacterium]|nr:YabP/YqfC family sporulation protein [Clostridia bacterium]
MRKNQKRGRNSQEYERTEDNIKKEKKSKEKILDLMDMPVELLQDTFRITMIGNKSILIEKYNSILEYDENIIRTSNGIMIQGTELNIEEINDNEIFVTGTLLNVELD